MRPRDNLVKTSTNTHRDLPTEIAYNGSVSKLLAKRNYSYDSLGRVVSRTQTRGNAASCFSIAKNGGNA
ncbi:MAG: hypothetical protein K6B46_01625 [Opitutales bacterium]|nr:hypothetical protein [Opitutales bacterium]